MKKVSRSKKALRNTAMEMVLELVVAVCSFILPRLILSHFGSAYNGITQSISQFIGCIALMKSGIGSVTRAALYKPLAENDSVGISEVVNATEGFMRKIALVFAVGIVAFAAAYPLLVSEDFDWFFSFSLVLILSISTFAQYFFGLTYQMVLQADQRNYVLAFVGILSTIGNTVVASVMILAGCSIHVVKLGSAAVFVLPPLFYMIYVRRHYKIDKTVKPNYGLISQRWDAFGHQLANFVNLNTNVILITMFLGVAEVSVYSVYNMVAHAIKKVITAVSSGTTAAFGNMIAKKETTVLHNRFRQFELLVFLLGTFLFTVTAIMIVPFIRVYTAGITDADYHRPVFAILLCVTEILLCAKIPYEQVVFAAGQFKKTRNMAYAEAVVHIVLSVVCVWIMGLEGILVGYIVASAMRVAVYHIYVSRNLIVRPLTAIVPKLLFTAGCFAGCLLISKLLPLHTISGYFQWVVWAVVVSVMTGAVTAVAALVMFRNDTIDVMKMLIRTLKRK